MRPTIMNATTRQELIDAHKGEAEYGNWPADYTARMIAAINALPDGTDLNALECPEDIDDEMTLSDEATVAMIIGYHWG